MLTIKKRFFVFNVVEYWYQCHYKWYEYFDLTAYMHVKNRDTKPTFMITRVSYTVENDLTKSDEEILAGCSKQFRNHIRGAEKDGVTVRFHRDIESFVPFFNEFAHAKGINGTSVRRLKEMGDNLIISSAMIDGKTIVSHSYYYDKESQIVHTYQSASIRLEDTIDKNLVGKANKYLHYQDMLHFKHMGVKTYDFGGYAPPTDKRDLQGINDFKLNFGGEVIACKNYVTIPYFIFKFLAGKMGFLGRG